MVAFPIDLFEILESERTGTIEAFTELFERVVSDMMTTELEAPTLEIASKIEFTQITPEFWSGLKKFEPFGPSNMTPLFLAESVRDTGHSRILDNNHARLSLYQYSSKPIFTGIGFGLGEAFNNVKHRPFDMVFSLREEEWRGNRKLAIHVRDLR